MSGYGKPVFIVVVVVVSGQCFTCSEKVTGASEACQAMGNLYHTNCFICCSCGEYSLYMIELFSAQSASSESLQTVCILVLLRSSSRRHTNNGDNNNYDNNNNTQHQ